LKYYLGWLILISTTVYSKEIPMIKVRIANSLKNVEISGYDLKRSLIPKSSIVQFEGVKKISFNCVSNTKFYKNKKPVRLATIESMTGMLNWEGHRFKGLFHIQTSEKFDGCDLINELTLEDYLTTLLPKEMSASWPIEALKAQAVAARSYALYKIKSKQVSKSYGYMINYDLESSEKHQVNGSYFDATESTIKATYDTSGEILSLFDNRLTPVFFHSKCGGQTFRPDEVWSNFLQGYKAVDCPYCHKHGTKNWKRVIPKDEFKSNVTDMLSFKKKSEVRLLQDNSEKSSLNLYYGEKFQLLKKSKLRSAMGRSVLPSNNYSIKEQKDGYIVEGSGYGHGVGMCQFGAKEMALQGLNYKQILSHYFPNLKLYKIY